MNQIAKQMEIDKVINILYRIIIDTIVNQIIKRGGGHSGALCIVFVTHSLDYLYHAKHSRTSILGVLKKQYTCMYPTGFVLRNSMKDFFSNKLD